MADLIDNIVRKRSKSTSAEQYEPVIIVNHERVPPVEFVSVSFIGKSFSFAKKCDPIKDELSVEISSLVTTIDTLPLKQFNKILIITRYIFFVLLFV